MGAVGGAGLTTSHCERLREKVSINPGAASKSLFKLQCVILGLIYNFSIGKKFIYCSQLASMHHHISKEPQFGQPSPPDNAFRN